jgi:putative ABC transport system permease protein
VLPEQYQYRSLQEKFSSLNKYLGAYDNAPFRPEFFLQPLSDIHLHSQINFEIGENSDIRHIWLFASIAIIILSLGSINYINLTTAVSSTRAKEVGVKKVLGAKKGQLVSQFLCGSFLLTIVSFVLAIVTAIALLPSFNQLLELSIPISIMGSGWLLIGMLALALGIGSLSGLYPGIFLSALLPAKVLKGALITSGKKGRFLRNFLVVGQFSSLMVLGIGSFIIFEQLQLIQNKKLGYNRERIVYVPYNNVDISSKIPAIRSELLKNPRIEKVSFPIYMPLNMISENIVNSWEGNSGTDKLWIYSDYVDSDFLDLFEIKLVEGKDFSTVNETNSSGNYILNETAVKALGWESPIGKQFRDGTVIGVVEDFHFQPFELAIKPMFLASRAVVPSDFDNIAIKIRMNEPEETIRYIQESLKTLLPHVLSECRFMEDDYDRMYKSEKLFGEAFNIFTVLAALIACMGLFGLVSHNVLQRTKEIGIRKVLGATTESIVKLLSKDFLKLIFISIIIGTPVAWFAMNEWLQGFAYKIRIEWWVFALTGLAALSIALLTISVQAIKAALTNPAKSLKSE